MEIKEILEWAKIRKKEVVDDRHNISNLMPNTGKLTILNELIKIIEISEGGSSS